MSNKKIILCLLILFASLWFIVNVLAPEERTLSVAGVGTEAVVSTKANITFVYSTTATARDAVNTAGQSEFEQLLGILGNFQVSDVKRIPAQVQPVAVRSATDTTQVEARFQYVTGAQVTITGSENVAGALRALDSDNIQIASIRYLPENETEVQARVQQAALDNARAKAESMARASGGRVGKVLSVVESVSNADTGSSVTSQLDGASQVELQSAVTVTFGLKPRWMVW